MSLSCYHLGMLEMPWAPAAAFSLKQEFCRPNSSSLLRKENFGIQYLFMKNISAFESCKDALSLLVRTHPGNSNMNCVLRRSHMKAFIPQSISKCQVCYFWTSLFKLKLVRSCFHHWLTEPGESLNHPFPLTYFLSAYLISSQCKMVNKICNNLWDFFPL